MTLVLCAHGTRSEAGREAVRALVAAVGDAGHEEVLDAYVDVHGPTLVERLEPGSVVVPIFLSTGHHVRVDVARAAAAVPGTYVAAPLGPSALLVDLLADRLDEVGSEPGTAVVLGAAGSSDDASAAATRRTAASLAARLSSPVHVAYGAARAPSVTARVAELRSGGGSGGGSGGAERIVVAAYLLATGHFHRRLLEAGADAVTAPLIDGGEVVDPRLVELVLARARQAVRLSA
jgi:sirohydrochlorin ferrochelatase